MSKEKSKLTLQVFALIIAIVLWGYVMSEVNPEQTDIYKNISVSFNNLDALERQGLVLMEPKDVTVNVKVRGNKTDLAKLLQLSKPIKAQVDLSGYSEGQVRVPIYAYIDQSSSVRVEKVEPSEILFTFDKLIERDKTITIKTEGNVADGYILGDITTKAQTILIRGPRSWVNEVAEVVASANVAGRKENTVLTVAVKLLDDQEKNVLGVSYEPTVIDLNIPIYRTVQLPIELQTEAVPDNYEITDIVIKPNKIALKGDNNIVNLNYVSTKPIPMDILMSNKEVPVELELPRGVSLVNPDEKITVSLAVEEAYTKTFEYTLNELELNGLDNELTIDYENSTNSIELVVKGPMEEIEALTKEDIIGSLNLGIYGEGTHNVFVDFTIPEGIKIKTIKPQIVELTLISR